MNIHQEIDIKASPDRIYKALTGAKQFSALTGNAPTEISRDEGGRFSVFGGMIVGRNIELVPDRRIVQAWRVKSWEPGLYSTVRFELRPKSTGTRIVFDHAGFPEGERVHLESGWHTNYWEPLKKTLV